MTLIEGHTYLCTKDYYDGSVLLYRAGLTYKASANFVLPDADGRFRTWQYEDEEVFRQHFVDTAAPISVPPGWELHIAGSDHPVSAEDLRLERAFTIQGGGRGAIVTLSNGTDDIACFIIDSIDIEKNLFYAQAYVDYRTQDELVVNPTNPFAITLATGQRYQRPSYAEINYLKTLLARHGYDFEDGVVTDEHPVPQIGATYYHVRFSPESATFFVAHRRNNDSRQDRAFFAAGNFFPNRRKAQEHAELLNDAISSHFTISRP